MIFLSALWHTAKVLSAGLYWLLMLAFIWAGLAQLGSNPSWGWGCLSLVVALFVLRGFITPRYVTVPVSYMIGCAVFAAYLLFAQTVTGHMVN